jgi:hypothetical protein
MYPFMQVHAPSIGPPRPVLLFGHGTSAQLPVCCLKYPTLHTQAVALAFVAVSRVALFDGHAVHLVPVLTPSPYVLAPHEHACVPGPVCVHTWPMPSQSSSSAAHALYWVHTCCALDMTVRLPILHDS